MKIKILLGLFSLLSMLKLKAFTLNNNVNLAFNHTNVKIHVASGLCANIGFSDEELLSMAEDAVIGYWNRVPTSKLKMKKGELKTVSSIFHSEPLYVNTTDNLPNSNLSVESDILISCNDNTASFPTEHILAATAPTHTTESTIVGSLILLNDTSVNNQLKTKSRDEMVAIISHEIGHAIGLGHAKMTNALMYYSVVPKRRSLGRDDMDGITYLYPKEEPVSCGSISDMNNKKNDHQSKSLLIEILAGLFISYFISLRLRPRFKHSAS